MSQLASTARAARPGGRRLTPPTPLRVVPGTAGSARGGLFAGFCLVALVGGFIVLLLLNTAIAKGSFVLHDLQDRSGELTDTVDTLNHAIDAQSAPAGLATRALALGMVPAQSPAFLRLSDGKVLGVAKKATAQDRFTVVTSPAPVAPGTAKSADAGPTTTVTRTGTVTTTTVTTPKAKGKVEVTVTSVDSATGRTTSTTTVKVVPAAPATATPGATAPTTATPTQGGPTTMPTR